MSPRTVVLRGRTAASRLMVDTGEIRRPGNPTLNVSTGISTTAATVVHTGRCWVRQPNSTEEERLFGETQVTTSRFLACFPHDVTGVKIDDLVAVTDSDDVDLIGRTFRVLAIPLTSFPLYKAFPCELVE